MPAGTPTSKKTTPRAAATATESKSVTGTSPAAAASKSATGATLAATASKAAAGAPLAAAASKSTAAAVPAVSSKSAASITEKKIATTCGGSSAAAAQPTPKSGSTTKTPRKSGEGSPATGRRSSNSSTGTSGGLEKSPKATKTGTTPHTTAATRKQTGCGVPAVDAGAKEEVSPAVERQSLAVSADTSAPSEASPPAACPVPLAADDGDVDVGSSSHGDAGEEASEDAGGAVASGCEVEGVTVGDSLTTASTSSTTPLICILGPPCSGKGTLAGLLQRQFGLQHISTGNLLREAAKEQGEDSEIGGIMKTGGLVPDDMVANLLMQALETHRNCKGVILDGFPRNPEQVKIMNNSLLYPGIVLVLKVPPEELLRRMAARREDLDKGKALGEGREPQDEEQRRLLVQRDDDTPEILQKRLDEYAEKEDSIFSSLSCFGCIADAGEKTITSIETQQQQPGQQQRCKVVNVDGYRDTKLIIEEVSAVLKQSFPTLS